MKTHQFEYDGQEITYRSGTVRDAFARRQICRKLLPLLGGEAVSDLDNDAAFDFADFLTHCSPFEADWRREPDASPADLLAGYQGFMAAPEDEVYHVFRDARSALHKLKEQAQHG